MKPDDVQLLIRKHWSWADQQASEKIIAYLNELKKWNKLINLTRIPMDKWCEKIVYESAQLASIAIQENRNEVTDVWMDMGTGAGIPGMILACLLPGQKICLVDSRQKKTDFLQKVVSDLKLDNVQVIHHRLEKIPGNLPALQNRIRVFFSRALADVDTLVKYADPLATDNALLISPRGESETGMCYIIKRSHSRTWAGSVYSVTVPGDEDIMHYAKLSLKVIQHV